MVEVLALDALLILILILLVPIGMYRGGLREVCSAAGVLLGILIAESWSDRWGGWLADSIGTNGGVARFVVAVGIIVLCGALVGYGAAASFGYRPGPGGRLYGGLIGLLTGIVFLGAVIRYVALYLYDGVYPELIREGYLSRALSSGFDWVLLAVAIGSVTATLFGMVVRERDTDDSYQIPHSVAVPMRRPTAVPSTAPEPVKVEPPDEPADDLQRTATLQIHEVRHWEEPTPPTIRDLKSGWSRTWPTDVVRPPTGSRPSSTRRAGRPARSESGGSQEDRVIQDWLAEDTERRRRDHPLGRPDTDE